MEQLQFFPTEKSIFLPDFFRKIVPFCRSAQFAGWLALGHPRRRFQESPLLQHRSIPKPSRRGKHAAGLVRTRLSNVASPVFCPRNSLFVTATARDPELPLCSARKHLAANSAHAFEPSVGPQRKNHRSAPECTSPGPCGRNGTPREDPPVSKT